MASQNLSEDHTAKMTRLAKKNFDFFELWDIYVKRGNQKKESVGDHSENAKIHLGYYTRASEFFVLFIKFLFLKEEVIF